MHHHSDGLFLNQAKYATDLLINAGMKDCAPVETPLPLKLDKVHGQDETFSDPSCFRSLAGKLKYLTLTRLDLQFFVNYICQKMHMPSQSDFLFSSEFYGMSKGLWRWGSESKQILTRRWCAIVIATGQAAETQDG